MLEAVSQIRKVCGQAAGGSAPVQDELKPGLHGSCEGWEECMKLMQVCKAKVGCRLESGDAGCGMYVPQG